MVFGLEPVEPHRLEEEKTPMNNVLWLLLGVGFFLWKTDLSFAEQEVPGRSSGLLWEIGKADRDTAELALAREGWQRYSSEFPAGPVYVVGRSDPKKDWPYVHPGPADRWAGSQQHTFTVLFGLEKEVPQGECRLILQLVDTHDKNPPHLQITLNGRSFEHQTPKGGPDDSLYGNPAAGKVHSAEIRFPASALKKGTNEITLTTLSGSWILYDWIGFEAPRAALLALPQETLLRSVSIPSVLVRKNGSLHQPVRVSLLHGGGEGAASVHVSGTEPVDQELRLGNNTVEVLLAAVEREASVTIEVKVAGKPIARREEILKPVRKWEVYLLHHSHVDIGYTHVQTEVERMQWENLKQAVFLARGTEEVAPEARFKWNAEVLWAVDSYLKQASNEDRYRFFTAVKNGQIGLDGLYGNELTALCRQEELFELIGCSHQLSKKYGIAIDSAMISDVPGYTWGIVPVLAQSGIRYFSVGPNSGHRIGYTLSEWGDRPFYWLSPCGKYKVLCWVAGKGYGYFHGRPLGRGGEAGHRMIFDYLKELEDSNYAYDMVQLRYSIGGDNGPPDPHLSEFVQEWNSRYAHPKLVIATTSEMFHDFERRYGGVLPTFRGDFTPYWEDGAGSSSLETGLNRGAAERLVQAEALWAMLEPAGYPAEEFRSAWRNVLLYDEHTWGAHSSIWDPEGEFTKSQWKIKQAFALDADRQSRELLHRALQKRRAGGEKVASAVVFNTSSWPRTDLIVLPGDWILPGPLVRDSQGRVVPSQRLSTGELAFLAEGVPPMGATRFTFHEGQAGVPAPARAQELELSNERIRVAIDKESGAINLLKYRGIPFNIVKEDGGGGLNDYLYVAGRDPKNLKRCGPVAIRVKEPGPLVASLLVESSAPGARGLVREVRIVSGLDRVDICNTIDKEKVFEQEGVHLAFPFHVPGGTMRMDIPWAVVQPEVDQLPGACKNYFTIQRWIDLSNPGFGVTWATLDAPLVEVGAVTADPIVVGWMKRIDPSETLYSYVMNNYWETNYKAEQEGPTVFRYSIKPHTGFDLAAAQRFGMEVSQPLIAMPAAEGAPGMDSLLRIEPACVLVTLLKPSEDGKGLVVRLFNAGQGMEKARVIWAEPKPQSVWLSNPREEEIGKVEGPIEMAPCEVVTLRASLPSR